MNTSFLLSHLTAKKILAAVALIAVAVVIKVVMIEFGWNNNVEPLTAVAIVAGALLGPWLGLLVGLSSVIGKDLIIGNTSILAYTWTAWALIGASSAWLYKRGNNTMLFQRSLQFTGWSVLTTLFFYAWTNFGVWHIGGLYPHTWAGLVDCYMMALPFLRNQLLGNLMFVPVISLAALTVRASMLKRSLTVPATTMIGAVVLAATLVWPGAMVQAEEDITYTLGILTQQGDDTMLKVVDSDGAVQARNRTLTTTEADLFLAPSTDTQHWVGEYTESNSGLEWIYTTGKRLYITNDQGETVKDFRIGKRSGERVVSVGDVDGEGGLQDIVTCDTTAQPARLAVHNYNANSDTVTKVTSFKPFPHQETDNNFGGCAAVATGDFNSDDDQDIIVLEETGTTFDSSNITQVVYFNQNGTRLGSFDLALNTNSLDKVYVADFDGDGYVNELGYVYGEDVVVLDNTGAELFRETSPVTAEFGDINNDGVAEVITAKRRKKVEVTIWQADGTVVSNFEAFTHGQRRHTRQLIVNDFSAYLN